MNDFDDPQIERLLGGAGGAFPDVNVAYGQVTRRVRQAKRRRAMVAGSAACVALFAGVAFAVRDGAQAPGLQPADSFTDGSTVTVDDSSPDDTATDNSATDDSSLPGESTLPDSGAPGDASNSTPSNSTANSGSTGTTPTEPTNTAGSTPSSPASTPTTPASTPSSPPTTAPAEPITQTFSGVGGSITVRLENGALTLVGSNAASGFTGEVKVNRGDRIEVIFDNGDHETKIRVDVVGNSMDPDISEN